MCYCYVTWDYVAKTTATLMCISLQQAYNMELRCGISKRKLSLSALCPLFVRNLASGNDHPRTNLRCTCRKEYRFPWHLVRDKQQLWDALGDIWTNQSAFDITVVFGPHHIPLPLVKDLAGVFEVHAKPRRTPSDSATHSHAQPELDWTVHKTFHPRGLWCRGIPSSAHSSPL